MAREGMRIVSTPSKATEPLRFPRMPMIDFRVVVLPAPLRPSRVTTSPGATSKVTPCRTWDSPYQASRSRTARSGAPAAFGPMRCASAASGMAHPDIGFDHARILRHGGVISFGKNPAPRQHGDPVGQGGDDRQVVLDHEDGAVGGDPADEGGDAVHVL